MADKSIDQLIAAESILATDLFVLQQSGMAKKLPGQVLLNWLTAAADGHGGIQSWLPLKTEGLVKTFRVTLADQTYIDIDVVDGRGVEEVRKIKTEGLVDTYKIVYNDGPAGTFQVTNGAKGEKGDNADIWVRYASQKPTAESHSFGELPDAWVGIASGHLSSAPTDWQAYTWYQWKGEKGDTGEPATLVSSDITYQAGDSGTIIPSGSWQTSVPVVAQGRYLWTRTTNNFNTGNPVVSYSVSRMGMDGSGSVSSVANISPDENGNVPLTASDVDALPNTGGDLTGELRMNGQPISGLNAPTENDQAANMGFVNQQVKKAAPRNLLDNSDFTNLVNQNGATSGQVTFGHIIDRWIVGSSDGSTNPVPYEVSTAGLTVGVNQVGYGSLRQRIDTIPAGKIMTAFAMTDNGELISGLAEDYMTSLGFYQIVFVVNKETTFRWACLYEGEYTIDTLPEYQPKGYGAELAKCQRYLQRFRTETERKTYCEDFRPTMRMTPNGGVSKFEQNVDGVTYYFASAEL